MSLDKKAKLFSFYGGEKVSFKEVAGNVGPGWEEILEDLVEKLLFLGWGGGLDQVKEKYGTLRFYLVNDVPGIGGEIVDDVVNQAEDKSSSVCEECGAYGTMRGDGWVKTSCDPCWARRKA